METIEEVEKLPVNYIPSELYGRVLEDFVNCKSKYAKVKMSFFGLSEGDKNMKRVYQALNRTRKQKGLKITMKVIGKVLFLIKL